MIALDNLATGRHDNIREHIGDPRFEFVMGSVINADLVDDLVARADVVFHLAAAVGVKLIVERPLESLVLADGTLEDLLDDLRTFYGSRSWYVQRGIPYRRGYLLHGPPGNGKTTLVLAAAGFTRMPDCVAVRAPFTVSVPVIDCVPAVFNALLKLCAPASLLVKE